jgi:hypothetical protein
MLTADPAAAGADVDPEPDEAGGVAGVVAGVEPEVEQPASATIANTATTMAASESNFFTWNLLDALARWSARVK